MDYSAGLGSPPMDAVVLVMVTALAYDLEHALQYSCEALPSPRAKSE